MVAFFKQVIRGWMEHDHARSAAAIAFYAIFTFAPTLVFAVTAAGMILGRGDQERAVVARVANEIGPGGAKIMRDAIKSARSAKAGRLVTLVSTVVMLWGASLTFAQLRQSLNNIFGFSQRRPQRPWLTWLLGRLVAIAIVLFLGALFVGTLLGALTLAWLSKWVETELGWGAAALQSGGQAVSFAAVTVAVVAMYRWLPFRRPPLRPVIVSAFVVAVFFEIGKWLFGLYFARSAVASAYGPSSVIVAFLVWIYYSAQILLVGAELCRWLMGSPSTEQTPSMSPQAAEPQ